MRYQTSLNVVEPISGKGYRVTVFGDHERTGANGDFPADVSIAISSCVSLSIRLRPADARALAESLAMAVAVAEAREAEIIPFSLDEAA